MERANRRQFLTAAGPAGLGSALGAGPAEASAGKRGRDRVEFYGAHQPGISTPTQGYVHFVSLDFASNSAGDLRSLLKTLSAAAAGLMAGRAVGPMRTGSSPPVGTGEAAGLGPPRLTVTIGLGPALFRPGRLGLASRRPEPLAKLPGFAGDALESSLCGGDIGIQICADDPR